LLGFRESEIKEIKTIKAANLISRRAFKLDFNQDRPLIRLGFSPLEIKWRRANQVHKLRSVSNCNVSNCNDWVKGF